MDDLILFYLSNITYEIVLIYVGIYKIENSFFLSVNIIFPFNL